MSLTARRCRPAWRPETKQRQSQDREILRNGFPDRLHLRGLPEKVLCKPPAPPTPGPPTQLTPLTPAWPPQPAASAPVSTEAPPPPPSERATGASAAAAAAERQE